MLGKNHKDNRGFTIIEVLIVLAIAGLIMLVVFMAVPALQRNQRNNTRKAEASRIATLVSECLSNNNGNTGLCNSAGELIGDGTTNATATLPTQEYKELTTLTYTATAATANKTTAIVYFGRQCNTSSQGFTSSGVSPRQFALAYKTESGGANEAWACING